MIILTVDKHRSKLLVKTVYLNDELVQKLEDNALWAELRFLESDLCEIEPIHNLTYDMVLTSSLNSRN